MKLTPAMKKRESLLTKDTLTKQEINSLGKLMNSLRFEKNEEKKEYIHEVLNKVQYMVTNITQEQTEVGIDWLKKSILNERTGKLRENKLAQDFNERDLNVIKTFVKFEFVGFYEHDNNWCSYFTPIYRTIGSNGDYFDYTAIHWGPCMINNRGNYPTKLEKALK